MILSLCRWLTGKWSGKWVLRSPSCIAGSWGSTWIGWGSGNRLRGWWWGSNRLRGERRKVEDRTHYNSLCDIQTANSNSSSNNTNSSNNSRSQSQPTLLNNSSSSNTITHHHTSTPIITIKHNTPHKSTPPVPPSTSPQISSISILSSWRILTIGSSRSWWRWGRAGTCWRPLIMSSWGGSWSSRLGWKGRLGLGLSVRMGLCVRMGMASCRVWGSFRYRTWRSTSRIWPRPSFTTIIIVKASNKININSINLTNLTPIPNTPHPTSPFAANFSPNRSNNSPSPNFNPKPVTSSHRTSPQPSPPTTCNSRLVMWYNCEGGWIKAGG